MIDISVIVCGHNEGRLLHRSLSSALRSISYAEKTRKIKIELIVSLDNPSESTLHYTKNSNYRKKFVLYNNNFNDLALSRNFAAEKANGKYLAFLDGDDLFEEKWLQKAFLLAEKTDKECVLHPEYYIAFEGKNLIWKRVSSTDSSFRFGSLLYVNPWDATIFLNNSIMSRIKFKECPRDSGWGYEDYDFFCNTLGEGIEHLVVPETVVFIRAKSEGSMLMNYASSNRVLYPNKLFEYEVLKNLIKDDDQSVSEEKSFKHKTLDRYPKLHLLLWKIKMGVLDYFEVPTRGSNYPGWLLGEWRNINLIEPELFPSNRTLREIVKYSPTFSDLMASIYLNIYSELGQNLKHLIFVPFIKVGGAEKVLFNFIKVLQEVYPKEEIAIISTEPSDSPWKDKLSKDITFVDIGNMGGLSYAEKEILLIRLLIQMHPHNIYNISSIRTFEILSKYQKSISENSNIFTFVFCPEYDEQGRISGFAFSYLDKQIDYNKKIFTDNQRYIDQLCDIYAFDKKKFVPLYQPAEIYDISKRKYSTEKKLNLLWASRLDRQKHPDIIYEIAKKCQDLPIKIDVYGTLVFEKFFDINKFKELPNINYCGTFSNGLKVISDNYDGFIYTSQYDGMPNIILEAVGVGLPIISSNVGGIGDLLENKNSALLVEKYNDIEEYRKQIEYALEHRKEFNEYAKVAQKEMLKKHNWKTLEETIKFNLK